MEFTRSIFQPKKYQGWELGAGLTADILISIRQTPRDGLPMRLWAQSVMAREITVVDRRDGRELATLRYAADPTRKKFCGAMENLAEGDLVDESVFLARALGL